MGAEPFNLTRWLRRGTPRMVSLNNGGPDGRQIATLAIAPDQRDHTKPFNIASYALLTHILAQQAGLEVGDFVWTGGDCHLYLNHLDQAREQLDRTPGPLPRLEILRRPESIDGYAYEDFAIRDYAAQPHIKAPVAV